METTADGHQGFKQQVLSLDTRYWIVNVMEMFERLAYYGVRAVVALYMVLATELGGPEFDHVQKGTIFAAWAFIQSVLPMFTGGFADRYGHKNIIAVAIVLKIIGYVLMAEMLSYGGFFLGCALLAAGTAIFKPGVQGTLAATLKEANASMGWGVFYQLVNVGGFLGPVLAGYLRNEFSWSWVFYACAVIVSVNFLWLPFYKDPTQEGHAHYDAEGQAAAFADVARGVGDRTVAFWGAAWLLINGWAAWKVYTAPSATTWMVLSMFILFLVGFADFYRRRDALREGRADPWSIFVVSIVGLFRHRVLWFCLVFAGFWLMFNQVFDLLPNVIDDWVDSSGIIGTLGAAFATPAVPTLLAVVLGLLFGGVCGAGVFLAMRPDRRPTADVTRPAYVVVALALAGALWPGAGLLLADFGGQVALVLALALAVVAYRARVPTRPIALAAVAVGSVGSFFAIRATLLAASPALVAAAEAGAQVNPEWMINLNPGLIVFTMIFFAYLTSFVKPLTSIILGMIVATAGSLVAGTATAGWSCLAGIFIFSIGEMLSSPKKMEYLATLSRKGQEALYMGYANIPVAIGWIVGSFYAGAAYEQTGDKVNLARRHLVEQVGMGQAEVDALQKTDIMPTLAARLDLTEPEVQALLFDTYRPQDLWWTIAAIGVASIVGMILYDRVIRHLNAKQAAAAAAG